jgi:hypothetical protein
VMTIPPIDTQLYVAFDPNGDIKTYRKKRVLSTL